MLTAFEINLNDYSAETLRAMARETKDANFLEVLAEFAIITGYFRVVTEIASNSFVTAETQKKILEREQEAYILNT